MSSLNDRARAVRLVVFDVDGVLTDGRLHYSSTGSESKSFHVRDGHGIKLLLAAGIEVAIISGRRSPAVDQRMRELGVRYVFQGHKDKLEVFSRLLADLKLSPAEVACVGDDVLDLPLLERVGLAVAVADAHPDLDGKTHWRTRLPGGRGAAREVCDLILRSRDAAAQ